MADPRPRLFDLVENTRKHLEDLERRVLKLPHADGVAPIRVSVETLHSDLDTIERTLSDMAASGQRLIVEGRPEP